MQNHSAAHYRQNIAHLMVASLLFLFSTFSYAAQHSQDTNNELTEAQQWLAEGEFQKAFKAFQFHAEEKQDPLAQFTFALFYQQGWGIKKDHKTACQWFGKAAYGKIPAANHFYAQCLENGTHQPADPLAAIDWYQKAVGLGHSISLCSIAQLYMHGKGVAKDPQKALGYCHQAAETGSIPAELQMGQLYLHGDKSIQDIKKAANWLEQAAHKGSLEASFQLGITNLSFANDPKHALYWFETAASQGYTPAYYPTAKLYFEAPVSDETGLPTEDNLAKAYLWLSTTQSQSTDNNELTHSSTMLEKVIQVMPESWIPTLDQQVSQHLSAFHQ